MNHVLGIREHAVLVQVEPFELTFLRHAQRTGRLDAYISANAATSVAAVTAPLPMA
jgi:hypothetical protein